MKKDNTLILGAGPAGLAAGFELHRAKREFTIIEKNETVGGISRTFQYGDFRTDIGPHRFYSKNQYLYHLIGDLLGEHWKKVDRLTRFFINGRYFLYPISLTNAILNAGVYKGIKIFFDYVNETIKNKLLNRKLYTFEDIAISEFGKSLAELNILNYTEKIWGLPCSNISPDWYIQRIKGLSISSVIKKTIIKSQEEPKTLVDQFYYPDMGAGLIYETICEKISGENNDNVKTYSYPIKIVHDSYKILEVVVKENGIEKSYKPTNVISSIPWDNLLSILEPAPPKDVLQAIKKLKFRSHVSLFVTIDKPQVFPDQWIYFPELKIPFGRIMEPKNFSIKMGPPDKTSLLLEFFCWENDKYWNMKKEELLKLSLPWLEKLDFLSEDDILNCFVHREKYAYPVYNLFYDRPRQIVKNYLNKLENFQLIGRAGNFRYNNQDHALEMGILAAKNLIDGKKYDLENVGIEQNYFESSYLKYDTKKDSKTIELENSTLPQEKVSVSSQVRNGDKKSHMKKKEKGILRTLIQFFNYIVWAGIATAIDMAILFLLTDFFLVHYLISAAIAYLCGMITNYSLNKYMNFKNKSKQLIPQFSIFAVIALIGLGLNELILFILVEFFGIWYIFSKVISVCIVVFWSFYGHKKFTFYLIK